MLRLFRNIATILVTWYVYSFFAGVLAYGAQFVSSVVGSSDRPGSIVLMHVASGVPHLLISFLAGMVAAAAVRPKADFKWVTALASLVFLSHLISTTMVLPISAWGAEDSIGILLVGALLAAGVIVGGSVIRRRAQLPA